MTDILKSINKRMSKICGLEFRRYREFPSDFENDNKEIIRFVRPYTMTSVEKLYALIQAVNYIVSADVPGDIVECGVWKGGSMMAIAKTLMQTKNQGRSLYLFDTYSGMTLPTDHDVNYHGLKALNKFAKKQLAENSSDWCFASIDEVKENLGKTGYDPSRLHFIRGRVEDTLPDQAPETIALLRLDTDWYESTRHELEQLFPRLSKNGVLIIDDYGHWQGCQKATDEYFAKYGINIFMARIDYSARAGIKL